MKCPKCNSDGWKKTEMTPSMSKVYLTLPGEKYTILYRICLMCGHKWKTIEQYFDQVQEKAA